MRNIKFRNSYISISTLLSILFFLVIIITNSTSQNNTIVWNKIYGLGSEHPSQIIKTSDDCYIVIGSSGSYNPTGSDIWMLKIDALGDTLWTKTYRTEYQHNGGYSIIEDSLGGFIVIGNYSKPIGGWHWNTNILFLNCNSQGDTISTKFFDYTMFDYSSFVMPTQDNNYLLSISNHLLKLNPIGNIIWEKVHDGNLSAITKNNEILLLGYDLQQGHIPITKTDINGDTLWYKKIHLGHDSYGLSLLETDSEKLYMTGFIEPLNRYPDPFLMKLNQQGDTLWTKIYQISGDNRFFKIIPTNDNCFVLGGTDRTYNKEQYYSDLWIAKVDTLGTIIWDKKFGGHENEFFVDIIQTDDLGYIILSATDSYGPDGRNIWIIKTDSLGNSNTPSSLPFYEEIIPYQISFYQNYPNPFNPSTTIKFSLHKSEHVLLDIYNMLGQKVMTLLNAQMTKGTHEIEYTAKNLPSGIYLYRINVGGFHDVKKMVLLR